MKKTDKTCKKLEQAGDKHSYLIPDYESEAFKFLQDAYDTGERIDVTGMTTEEMLEVLFGEKEKN